MSVFFRIGPLAFDARRLRKGTFTGRYGRLRRKTEWIGAPRRGSHRGWVAKHLLWRIFVIETPRARQDEPAGHG